jgi:hypothetical protein
MAVSEWVGEKCHVCGQTWKSCSDFDRVDVTDELVVDVETDGNVHDAIYWTIRCNLCGATKKYLHTTC